MSSTLRTRSRTQPPPKDRQRLGRDQRDSRDSKDTRDSRDRTSRYGVSGHSIPTISPPLTHTFTHIPSPQFPPASPQFPSTASYVSPRLPLPSPPTPASLEAAARRASSLDLGGRVASELPSSPLASEFSPSSYNDGVSSPVTPSPPTSRQISTSASYSSINPYLPSSPPNPPSDPPYSGTSHSSSNSTSSSLLGLFFSRASNIRSKSSAAPRVGSSGYAPSQQPHQPQANTAAARPISYAPPSSAPATSVAPPLSPPLAPTSLRADDPANVRSLTQVYDQLRRDEQRIRDHLVRRQSSRRGRRPAGDMDFESDVGALSNKTQMLGVDAVAHSVSATAVATSVSASTSPPRPSVSTNATIQQHVARSSDGASAVTVRPQAPMQGITDTSNAHHVPRPGVRRVDGPSTSTATSLTSTPTPSITSPPSLDIVTVTPVPPVSFPTLSASHTGGAAGAEEIHAVPNAAAVVQLVTNGITSPKRPQIGDDSSPQRPQVAAAYTIAGVAPVAPPRTPPRQVPLGARPQPVVHGQSGLGTNHSQLHTQVPSAAPAAGPAALPNMGMGPSSAQPHARTSVNGAAPPLPPKLGGRDRRRLLESPDLVPSKSDDREALSSQIGSDTHPGPTSTIAPAGSPLPNLDSSAPTSPSSMPASASDLSPHSPALRLTTPLGSSALALSLNLNMDIDLIDEGSDVGTPASMARFPLPMLRSMSATSFHDVEDEGDGEKARDRGRNSNGAGGSVHPHAPLAQQQVTGPLNTHQTSLSGWRFPLPSFPSTGGGVAGSRFSTTSRSEASGDEDGWSASDSLADTDSPRRSVFVSGGNISREFQLVEVGNTSGTKSVGQQGKEVVQALAELKTDRVPVTPGRVPAAAGSAGIPAPTERRPQDVTAISTAEIPGSDISVAPLANPYTLLESPTVPERMASPGASTPSSPMFPSPVVPVPPGPAIHTVLPSPRPEGFQSRIKYVQPAGTTQVKPAQIQPVVAPPPSQSEQKQADADSGAPAPGPTLSQPPLAKFPRRANTDIQPVSDTLVTTPIPIAPFTPVSPPQPYQKITRGPHPATLPSAATPLSRPTSDASATTLIEPDIAGEVQVHHPALPRRSGHTPTSSMSGTPPAPNPVNGRSVTAFQHAPLGTEISPPKRTTSLSWRPSPGDEGFPRKVEAELESDSGEKPPAPGAVMAALGEDASKKKGRKRFSWLADEDDEASSEPPILSDLTLPAIDGEKILGPFKVSIEESSTAVKVQRNEPRPLDPDADDMVPLLEDVTSLFFSPGGMLGLPSTLTSLSVIDVPIAILPRSLLEALQITLEVFVWESCGTERWEGAPEGMKVTTLRCRGNSFRTIPDEVGTWTTLDVVDLSQNKIEWLPNSFFRQALSVRYLDLSDNALSFLPSSLGLLSHLHYLGLEGNPWDPDLLPIIGPAMEAESALKVAKAVVGPPGRDTFRGAVPGVARDSSSATASARNWRTTSAMLPSSATVPSSLSDSAGNTRRLSHSSFTLATANGSAEGSSVMEPSDISPITAGRSWSGSVRESVLWENGRPASGTESAGSSPKSTPADGLSPSIVARRQRVVRRLAMHLRDVYDLDLEIRRTEEAEREARLRVLIKAQGERTAALMEEESSMVRNRAGRPLSMASLDSYMSHPSMLLREGSPSRPVVAKKRKPPSHRLHIIKEILATEKTYVTQLGHLMELYVKPLEGRTADGTRGERVLTPEEHRRMFMNVGAIYQLHKDHLLPALEEACVETSPEEQGLKGRIGRAFLQFAPFLKLYGIYATSFEASAKLIERFESDRIDGKDGKLSRLTVRKYKDVVSRARRDPRHTQLNLQAWMLLPLQRLMRFPLLLKSLLEVTSDGHPDEFELERALTEIEKRVLEANDRKREWEGVQSVVSGVLRGIRVRDSEPAAMVEEETSVVNDGASVYSFEAKRVKSVPSTAWSTSSARSSADNESIAPSLNGTITISSGAELLKLTTSRRRLLRSAKWRVVRVLAKSDVSDSAIAYFLDAYDASGRSGPRMGRPAAAIKRVGGRLKESIVTVISSDGEVGREDMFLLFTDTLVWCKVGMDAGVAGPGQKGSYTLIRAFDLDRAGDKDRGIARVVDSRDMPTPVPGMRWDDPTSSGNPVVSIASSSTSVGSSGSGSYGSGDKLLRVSDPGGEVVIYLAPIKGADTELMQWMEELNSSP
ncbi:hypothetical protein HDU93_006846 [Gonapodya sp. JEL0774]|nr:hypothetical protein HDU93_006846 [Gonapodya sp. JEL0774]